MSNSRIFLVLAAVVAWAVWPRAAWAYLDPASGSLLLQLILGGIAGAVLFLKLFWHKLLGFFGVESKDDDSSD